MMKLLKLRVKISPLNFVFSAIFILAFSNLYGEFLNTAKGIQDNFENTIVNLDFELMENTDPNKFPKFKKKIGRYHGFYLEGENLKRTCVDSGLEETVKINQDVLLSFLSTLQQDGLNHAISSIGQYAYQLGLAKSEYKNFSQRLVDNYCSKNLTLFSHKKVKELLNTSFNGSYELPQVLKNPYLNPLAKASVYNRVFETNEFKVSIDLFKSLCSWGHHPYEADALEYFFSDAAIAAHLKRVLDNKQLKWSLKEKRVGLIKANEKVKKNKVICKDLFCRSYKDQEFKEKFFALAGTSTDKLGQSVEYYFCQLRSKLNRKQMAENNTFFSSLNKVDKKRVLSHYKALVTKVPDLFLRVKNQAQREELLVSKINYRWDQWSRDSLSKSSRNLYYEEPLIIESIIENQKINNLSSDFKLEYAINLGEIDRSYSTLGKLKTRFDLKIEKSLLRYIRSRLKNYIYHDSGQQEYEDLEKELVNFLNIQIASQLNNVHKKFSNSLWNEQFNYLVSKEIVYQVESYQGDYFNKFSTAKISLPVYLYFSPYALKYIYYKNQVQENKDSKNFKIDLLYDISSL